MSTYKSAAFNKGGRVRPESATNAEETTVSYTYPNGTAVVSGDIIKMANLGENVRVLSIELDVDGSLATSGLTTSVGYTGAATAFVNASSAIGNGAASILARIDGEATANDSFATTPYSVGTSVRELIVTFGGTIVSAVSNTDRVITLRVKHQYAYPDNYVSGVSSPSYPLSGSKSTSNAIVLDYNGNAP